MTKARARTTEREERAKDVVGRGGSERKRGGKRQSIKHTKVERRILNLKIEGQESKAGRELYSTQKDRAGHDGDGFKPKESQKRGQ